MNLEEKLTIFDENFGIFEPCIRLYDVILKKLHYWKLVSLGWFNLMMRSNAKPNPFYLGLGTEILDWN